jgi:hypothetical protein
MKKFFIPVVAMLVSLTACSKSGNRQTADQTSDTNLTASNQPRIDNDKSVGVNVKVDTDEVKGALKDAAGAAKEKLGRAADKIDTAARDFGDKISRSLRDDPKYSASSRGVEVSSNNGKVTIQGTVKTEDEKRDLESRIRELTGASEVNNQIRVSAEVK